MKRLLVCLLLLLVEGCGKSDQHGYDPDAHGDHREQTHDNPNGEAEPNSTIAAYTEAIRKNPDDATAYFKRGDAYGANGEYDKAIADLTEVIRLDPNYPGADSRLKFASRLKDARDKTATGPKATPTKPVESQEILTLNGHSGSVYSVSFSPDGKRIVSGSDDNLLKVWDANSGQALQTLKGDAFYVYSVSFSPDGKRIVSGGDDKTVKVWDAENGQEILTLTGHSESVNSVSFSPDGKRIVSGSDDKTLKIWDAESGQETLTLKGHSIGVSSVAFSPDGQRIVSAGINVKIWDASE
jgi:WD40 repeat protein